MPTTKKTSVTSTKKAVKSTAKVNVSVHMPGEVPAKKSFTKGTTIAQLVESMNLTGYAIVLNGKTVSSTSNVALSKDDVLRVGVPTKNG